VLNVIICLLSNGVVQVKDQLHLAGFMCDVDVDPGDTMNKKIRNAQLAQYNFILGKLSLSSSL
jgi:threonyl-tRNA synthetase